MNSPLRGLGRRPTPRKEQIKGAAGACGASRRIRTAFQTLVGFHEGARNPMVRHKKTRVSEKPGISLFHPSGLLAVMPCWPEGTDARVAQAGLLTFGSSYKLRLPTLSREAVASMQPSFPITAAGPFPIFTGFPFKPKSTWTALRYQEARCVSSAENHKNRLGHGALEGGYPAASLSWPWRRPALLNERTIRTMFPHSRTRRSPSFHCRRFAHPIRFQGTGFHWSARSPPPRSLSDNGLAASFRLKVV